MKTYEQNFLQKKIKTIFCALSFWQLLNTIFLAPEAREVLGTRNFAAAKNTISNSVNQNSFFFEIFNSARSSPLVFLSILGFLCLLISVVKNKKILLVWPVVVLLGRMLDAMAPEVLDGGNNLFQLVSLFSLGFLPYIFKQTIATRSLATGALFLCQVQVCFLYFTAGWAKVMGAEWQSGLALFYILQNRDFSTEFLSKIVVRNFALSTIGSYFALTFQSAFPWLIWFKNARLPLVFAGVLLHTGIAFFMGLPLFSLMMCISYLFFLSETDFEFFENAFNSKRRLFLGIDSKCKPCLFFAKLLKRVDFGNKIEIDDCWQPKHLGLAQLSIGSRTSEMAAVVSFEDSNKIEANETQSNVQFGFHAIRFICREVWILLPIAIFLEAPICHKIGEKAYSWIAANRRKAGCNSSCEL